VGSAVMIALTCAYAAIFAYVFRQFAFAEPGGFPAFYTSGKLARYDLSGLFNKHLQDVFHPGNLGTGYFFHLPYELILLVPLSYLPQVAAYVVWSVLNLGCLYAAARILRRRFPRFNVLMPFAFAPTLILLLNGQDLGLLALVVALAFGRFADGEDMQAGAILAVGLFKFPLIVPLVAILAVRYWRVVAGFAAVAVPLLIGSAAVIGRKGVEDYVALTRGTDAKEAPVILVNLRGAVGVLFGQHTGVVIGLSIVVVAIAALVRADRVWMFSTAVVATLLVSWHAHHYDLVLLLIPMAAMTESERRWIRYTPMILLLAAAGVLASYAYAYLMAFALCGLFAGLVTELARRRESARVSVPCP